MRRRKEVNGENTKGDRVERIEGGREGEGERDGVQGWEGVKRRESTSGWVSVTADGDGEQRREQRRDKAHR